KFFECLLVDLITFTKVDRAAHISFEAGIEQASGVLERSPLCEGQLDDRPVGLARADDAGMFPNTHAAPLPGLDHVRIGLFYQCPQPEQHFAAPVTKRCDSFVDQLRGRIVFSASLSVRHGATRPPASLTCYMRSPGNRLAWRIQSVSRASSNWSFS